MSPKKTFAIISLLLLSALACSLTSSGAEKTEETAPSVQNQNAESPLDENAAEENTEKRSEFISPQLAENIRSFRVRISYSTKLPDGSTQQMMTSEGEYLNTEPPAEHIIMTMDLGDENGTETMEYLRADSQIWMFYADQWISLNDDGMDFLADMLPNAAEIADLDWKKIGQEEVNGVKTTHYRVTESTPGMLNIFNQSETEDVEDDYDIFAAQIDIYVNDDNVIIKQNITAQSKKPTEEGEDAQPLDLTFSFEVYDINADDIAIEAPTNEQTGLGTPLPVPENAISSLNAPGFSVYNIPSENADAVLAFYEGYGNLTVSEKMDFAENGYMLTVQFEGQEYNLTISPAENGGTDISIANAAE